MKLRFRIFREEPYNNSNVRPQIIEQYVCVNLGISKYYGHENPRVPNDINRWELMASRSYKRLFIHTDRSIFYF